MWHDIEKIDVSKNTKLVELYVNSTGITNLDVSNNTALELLYCFDTDIAALNLSANTKLKELVCYGTNITELDLSTNTDLECLWSYGLDIAVLDLTNNSNLTDVIVDATDEIWLPNSSAIEMFIIDSTLPTVYYIDRAWINCVSIDNEDGDVTWVLVTEDGEIVDTADDSTGTTGDISFVAFVDDATAYVVISIDYYSMTAGEALTVNVDTDGEEVDSLEASIDVVTILEAYFSEVTEFAITTNDMTVSFDSEALGYLSDYIMAGDYVEMILNIDKVDVSTLDEDVQAVIGDRPVYELTASIEGVAITEFGDGTVSVTVPYTLADGESADGVVVYYIDADNNLIAMETTYDVDTETVTFVTDHFSTFAVGYEEVSSSSDDSTPETGDTTNVALFVVLALMAGCGVVVFERRRRTF